MLCPDLPHGGADQLTERVTDAATGQVCVDDIRTDISVSVGIVHGTDLRVRHEDTALADLEIWLRAADVSMFSHKRRRKHPPSLLEPLS